MSFFSTSRNRAVALCLLDTLFQRQDGSQNILFEIECDSRLMSQPFGDISSLSAIADENEVLFTIGSNFELVECSYDVNTNVYLAKLKLEDVLAVKLDYDLTGITARATMKNYIDEILNHLYRASLEEINTLFIELYELFPSEQEWLCATKHRCIAKIYIMFHVKHYPEFIGLTLSTLEQALTIYQSYLNDSELDCAVDIGEIHHEMGFIYHVYVEDDTLANKHYDLGITSCASSLQTMVNERKRIGLYVTIGRIYGSKIAITSDETQRRKIVLDGIRYEQLQLDEMLSYLPSDHLDLMGCIISLARLQNSIGLVTEALMNYEKVVQMHLLKHDPALYSSAMIYGEVSDMCVEQKGDYTIALHYKQKQLEYEMKNRAVNPDKTEFGARQTRGELIKRHQELADIHIKLSQYELAYENLIMTKQFYEDSDSYNKKEKIIAIEKQMESIEQFLSQDHEATKYLQ